MNTQTTLVVGKVKNQTPTMGEHWHIRAVGRKRMRDKYNKLETLGDLHSKNINSGKSCKIKYPKASYKTDPKPSNISFKNYQTNFIGRMS